MTNIDIIKFIDEFLREQEDVLHGTEGENCTKSRKYLSMLEKQLTLTVVSQRSELVCELGKETDDCGNFAINGRTCDGCNHFKQTCG